MTDDPRNDAAAMRVARPTADLAAIQAFYEDVVGLPVLWAFADHEDFDGVIFGVPDALAQLELVRSPHGDLPTPTPEDTLVLYAARIASRPLPSYPTASIAAIAAIESYEAAVELTTNVRRAPVPPGAAGRAPVTHRRRRCPWRGGDQVRTISPPPGRRASRRPHRQPGRPDPARRASSRRRRP